MNTRKILAATTALSFAVFAAPVSITAEENDEIVIEDASVDSNMTIEEKVDILSKEVERLKAGRSLFGKAPEKGKHGVGPAASKIYDIDSGVSIGGYGEIHYEHPVAPQKSENGRTKYNEYDALRGIFYFGYKYNDNIIFNSEIEFEHADEAYLEFSYLDFMIHRAFNFRAGLILIPMGLVNEMHESPTYLSVNRPETEKRIIPSTWRENGAGFFGEFKGLEYRIYAVNGLKGEKFDGSGLRSGRQKGSNATAEDLAVTGRLDYTGFNGVLFGISGYYGNSGQQHGFEATTMVSSIYYQVQVAGLYLRGLAAFATVTDSEEIEMVKSQQSSSYSIGDNPVGEEMAGAYFELGYDIFNLIDNPQKLILFGRYEALNTQAKMASNYTAQKKYDRQLITFGVSYKPVHQVALKADYIIETNEAETGFSSFNMAMSYLF